MKTLNDYITRYSTIASNLGYVGESTNLLVQLLAQASYISEVENITYQAESSLEKASLLNSKIQHCMDMMYSVYRGECPRVVMRIRPTKYLKLTQYDTLVTSQNFNIHYLAAGKNIGTGKSVKWEFFNYTIPPAISIDNEPEDKNGWYQEGSTWWRESDVWYILGFVAPKRVGENLVADGSTGGWKTINLGSDLYIESTANNLSNDLYVEASWFDEDKGGDQVFRVPTTRMFSEHVMENKIFDLTLTGFGSRLYFSDFLKSIGQNGLQEGQYKLKAQFYGYSELGDYNQSELKKVKLKGGELLPFPEDIVYYNNEDWGDGLFYIPATKRDDTGSIHYKASKDRYVNSLLRSNSDITILLEDSFPSMIVNGGTTYKYEVDKDGVSFLTLYYIPEGDGIPNDDTNNEIGTLSVELDEDGPTLEEFKNKFSYYVTDKDHTWVKKGKKYTISFDIAIEQFNNGVQTNWITEIGQDILVEMYENKFNVVIDKDEIISLICKNSNVKKVIDFSYTIVDSETGELWRYEDIDTGISYFEVQYTIK